MRNPLPSGIPEAVRDELLRITQQLAAHPLLRKAFLFGSFAVGTFHADSDIDIAVFLDRHHPCTLAEYKQVNRLIAGGGFDVQLQVFSESELEDPCGIIQEIVGTGLVLLDAAENG